MLTPDKLLSIFDYHSETGTLTRKNSSKGYHGNREITRLNDQGYLVTTLDGETHRVHHLIWLIHYGYSVKEIDHINRNKSDNRVVNLRDCSHLQNCGNSGVRTTNTSGYKGVTFCKKTGRWKAQIGINYKNVNIGRFDTPELAALAYNRMALEHFGEFAYLNEVGS